MSQSKRKTGPPRQHIVLRLCKGWTYDSRARQFCKKGEQPFRPGTELPKYTRIAVQIPSTARKRKRSAVEDELARGLQVVPPKGASATDVLACVREWPCVEKAWVAPEPVPATSAPPRPGRGKGRSNP